MKNAPQHQKTRRGLLIAFLTILTIVPVTSLHPGNAGEVTPPPFPANLQVPGESTAFLEGYATGTQNYVCLPAGSGFAWAFLGPQAVVFDDRGNQIVTHFLSPNPSESGTPRATWVHSKDTSTVWAVAIASSTDPDFVAPGSIPWLLLDVFGAQEGTNDGDRLVATSYIQRLNTTGGIAPGTGCSSAGDVGKRAFVPYTADYFFYRTRE